MLLLLLLSLVKLNFKYCVLVDISILASDDVFKSSVVPGTLVTVSISV